jgi:hypothetical protein
MYIFIGVVLVAAGVRSWNPPPYTSWPDHLLWAMAEVLLWPKVLPELVRSGQTPAVF